MVDKMLYIGYACISFGKKNIAQKRGECKKMWAGVFRIPKFMFRYFYLPEIRG